MKRVSLTDKVLTPYDDLFKSTDVVKEALQENIIEVILDDLHRFNKHPFKIIDDINMKKLVESIDMYGVLSPAIVRPHIDGGYELISGHRRKYACELLGKKTIPVIVKDLDDDMATIYMVDSNLQREKLLPSEKAFAYKMKLEAMKRSAGRPYKDNSSQVNQEKRSDQILAEQMGESRNQIQRYIRLTQLIEELLDMVDKKRLSFNIGVELSYLKISEQQDLASIILLKKTVPTLDKSRKLKEYSKDNNLTPNEIEGILFDNEISKLKLILPRDTVEKYFPRNYTQEQIQNVIFDLLERWSKEQ